MSHPTWVRGLKPTAKDMTMKVCSRRTLRGCVDWNSTAELSALATFVAPYVGAWIETRAALSTLWLEIVAPYVGAWIETRYL